MLRQIPVLILPMEAVEEMGTTLNPRRTVKRNAFIDKVSTRTDETFEMF